MEHLISNYGLFALFLIIVAIVCIEARHNPKMMAACAADDVNTWVERIEKAMRDCPTLESLDRLEKEGDKILSKAKAIVSDTKPYADRLLIAYNNRHWYLVNIECAGIPQHLIPFLTIR